MRNEKVEVEIKQNGKTIVAEEMEVEEIKDRELVLKSANPPTKEMEESEEHANEQLIERLRAMLKDPKTSKEIRDAIRQLLEKHGTTKKKIQKYSYEQAEFLEDCTCKGKSVEECLHLWKERNRGDLQPIHGKSDLAKKYANPLNIGPNELMNADVRELAEKAGWVRTNPRYSDPMRRDYEFVESWRKRNAQVDKICESVLSGTFGEELLDMPAEQIMKMGHDFATKLKRWHAYIALHGTEQETTMIRKDRELTLEEKQRLLANEKVQKRGIVHQTPIREINSPMDYTPQELLKGDIKSLMRKAGFVPVEH